MAEVKDVMTPEELMDVANQQVVNKPARMELEKERIVNQPYCDEKFLEALKNKPPLGATPEKIWLERRVYDLVGAAQRQIKDSDGPNWELIDDWLGEARRHASYIRVLNKKVRT